MSRSDNMVELILALTNSPVMPQKEAQTKTMQGETAS
jgi:hypothetical protein